MHAYSWILDETVQVSYLAQGRQGSAAPGNWAESSPLPARFPTPRAILPPAGSVRVVWRLFLRMLPFRRGSAVHPDGQRPLRAAHPGRPHFSCRVPLSSPLSRRPVIHRDATSKHTGTALPLIWFHIFHIFLQNQNYQHSPYAKYAK